MFSDSQNRSARSSRRSFLLTAASVAALMLVLVAPHNEATPSSADRAVSLPDIWLDGGGKRYDKGLWDLLTINPVLPSAWRFVESSTLGGTGVEYGIFHSSHVPPSFSNPDSTVQYVLDTNNNPLTLTEALNAIVAEHPHVSSASELTVYKYVVSPIQ